MRSRRVEAAAQDPQAAVTLRDLFLENIDLPPASLVAATLAQNGEIDPAPLAAALLAQGHGLCLPVVVAADKALVFRAWKPGDPLLPGAFGIPEPLAHKPAVEPNVLLVPLVAFDRRGNRLGQGGGYYDRTLAQRRRKPGVLAIGLGFSVQEAPSVPAASGDQSLDLIVTEKEIIRTGLLPHSSLTASP